MTGRADAQMPIPARSAEISGPNEPPPYGCGCGARWGGLKTCHCTGCHQTFTAITAFDAHRTGSHPDETRHCLQPGSVGLIDAGRGYPCWGAAGAESHWSDE